MCQKFSDQQSNKLALKPCNGLAPGSATSESRKKPGDELENNGALEQLSGQKGGGPSLSKIEEAESGSGVSGNYTTKKAQDFSRQMESFVERDDVPEELKSGVREYFKRIHDADQSTNQ
ncbi:hypothetical protein [Rubritalea tangerina]|uniref:Uncharacterized protein n=1 Tax=Rubritalea tangerina TaxID=430798 RepID=A0ABW4ZAL2_9BACT